MRTTVNIDDELFEDAKWLTGIEARPPWCERASEPWSNARAPADWPSSAGLSHS